MSISQSPALTRISLIAAAALALAGCESMSERQKGTAVGAGAGALVGAAIGSVTGGNAATGALIGGALGAVGGNLWSKRMEDKKAQMEKATAGTGIDVERTPDNQLKVNIPSDLSFAVGRADLNPSLRPVLEQFAAGLDQTTLVLIVGHTDSTGNDAINNPLSVERADSVRSYLAGRGVATTRIEIAGEGSRQPVADNGTEAGRAQNRRVEIFLRDPAPQG
jgi:outer membrane protein OmpA-like peptidoglycan-associated protein